MIPGLENARFLRYGQIHRNTYIRPRCCWTKHSASRKRHGSCLPASFPASRVTRSPSPPAAGRSLRRRAGSWRGTIAAPRASALGSLVHYIAHADPKDFQPANITFDLLEPLEEELRKKIRDKKERHRLVCERALAAFDDWWASRDSGKPLIRTSALEQARMSDFSRRIAGKGSRDSIRGGGSSNERRPKNHGWRWWLQWYKASTYLFMMGIGVASLGATHSPSCAQACSPVRGQLSHSAPSCSPSCGGCGSHFQVSNPFACPSPHSREAGHCSSH